MSKLRKIATYTSGIHECRVYRDAGLDEYRVRYFINGELRTLGDYFTADKADALDTAQHMVRNMARGGLA